MRESSYVTEAFKLKPNLLFLGGGLVAAALFGSVAVLGVVAGLEAGYLYSMAKNPRFRRAIRSRTR